MSNATDVTERTEADLVIPYKTDWLFLALCVIPVAVIALFLFASP
jgi:hypothetical protein